MLPNNIETLVKDSSLQIIQGGMGVGISDWHLAKTVSQNGGLGVVSGTGIDNVLVRRLQLGDSDGRIRYAMEQFPFQSVSEKVLDKYFIPEGKKPDVQFKLPGMFTINSDVELLQLTTLSNFVEVFLAKEGHSNPVGINYLEKIQMSLLPSIYGAMLAGVDYVLMGAGIPRQIPGVLDLFVSHNSVNYKLNVIGNKDNNISVNFNPKKILGSLKSDLKRPDFLGIISSATLALTLAKKASGKVNGFVIEEPVAGGHNAPPRGKYSFNEIGEPIYGIKDEVNLEKIASLGLPFWLAGGYGSPEKLRYALSLGAQGIQVGSLFFLSDESGLNNIIKKELIERLVKEDLMIYTDPVASPTGFPFKILLLNGSLSEQSVYDKRIRICDLGYLRTPFERPDGSIGYRCPSEPVNSYESKGGLMDDAIGRKCLCNALMANIGLAQVRKTGLELPILTAGNDINSIRRLLKDSKTSFSVVDVMDYLRG